MTIPRLVALALIAIALVAIVGAATGLDVDAGSIFVWTEKIDPPVSKNTLQAEFHSSTPTVNLTWEPHDEIDHYNVYRGKDGGAFAVIASSPTAWYEDTTVQEGNTYTYFVTAVSLNGLESQPSNKVTVETTVATPTPEPSAEPTDEPTPDSQAAGTSLSKDQALLLGGSWIADNAGAVYQFSEESCNAGRDGAHWVVTCVGELEGCQASGCWVSFQACVFGEPPVRNWC